MSIALQIRPAEWLLNVGEPVVAIDSSPSATHWAALTTEGQAVLGEVASGRVLKQWGAHAGGGFRLAWHPKAELVATTGADGLVKLWNPATAELAHSFPGGAEWVEQLEWSPDGEFLAVGGGKTLTLWTQAGGVVHTLSKHRSTLSALCWRHDSRQLGAACYGGVQVYDPSTGAELYQLPWKTSLLSLAWSSDQKWVVAGTQESSVQIWPQPFKPGDELAMSGYPAKVRELAWHPGGRYLATGGGDSVMVWDCGGAGPAGTEPRILDGHTGLITGLAYQVRGHQLASAGADGRVLFWNVKQSPALREIKLPAGLTVLAWLRNDQAVLAGGRDGSVALARAPGA